MAYKKGNWKPKTKEQKQKELDDLIKASNSKIEQYQSNPEDMIEFAKFMSKIHNYSPLNLSLIDEGFEGAIAVASYDGWKKLGFQVKAKEKGIGIYAHAPVTVFIDENGEEKTLKEATNEQKEKIKNGELRSKKIKHFKKGYVFDIFQTNATEADLPKIFPNRVWNFNIDGELSVSQLEKGVNHLAESMNISIKDMNESGRGEMGSARGEYIQYVDGREEIVLNSRNSRTQNLTTSIHELAHKKLHNKNEHGSSYSTPIKEFQAEMTSFIVCHNYGIDTSDFTIPYIANWTKNNEKIDPKNFRQIMQEVRETSIDFISTIDKKVLEEQQTAFNALKNSFVPNENKEQIQQKSDLEFHNFYDSTINDPDRTIHGSYLEAMVDYYRGKYGENSIELTHSNYDVTAKIGENYVTYYSDTKQFDVCDVYGVVFENPSENKHDRLLLDRSPENCDYVEKFVVESLKACENHELKNDTLKLSEPLRSVVINEAVYNLSENANNYYNEKCWQEEIENQTNINDVKELNSCMTAEDFYESHKQEIENTITDFESVSGTNLRDTIDNESYKEVASVVAYKLVATKVKYEMDEGTFKIPENSNLEKPTVKTAERSFEME